MGMKEVSHPKWITALRNICRIDSFLWKGFDLKAFAFDFDISMEEHGDIRLRIQTEKFTYFVSRDTNPVGWYMEIYSKEAGDYITDFIHLPDNEQLAEDIIQQIKMTEGDLFPL